MISRHPEAARKLEDQYTTRRADVDFGAFLRAQGSLNDDQIAELIEADGRIRVSLKLPVELSRYLDAVRGLRDLPVSLDAAIDMTLRSMRERGHEAGGAASALASRHPELARSIRDAAVLDDAIWSTRSLKDAVEQRAERPFPGDLGPATPAGSPRYHLLDRIGSGSQGDVYRAEDRVLSDDGHAAMVAVKVLSSIRTGTYARQRLIEEATKARRVVHPNVVRVLDRGVAPDGDDFIVYELVEGGDLGEFAKDRLPLPADEAARIMAKVARGVHAAHAAALVHCDLKPGNIMVSPEGEPKVADFGIAVRLALSDSEALAIGARPVGNIAFASPEQFRADEGAASASSDVYALGGILYYLLTGHLPNGETEAEIAATHDAATGRTRPPRLADHLARVDGDLELICSRALALDSHARHSSAAALADDLEAWLRREPIAWTRPSMWRILSLFARRRPITAGVLVTLVATTAVGGAAATHFWHQSQVHAQAVVTEVVRAEERRQGAIQAATSLLGQNKAVLHGRLASQTLSQSLMLEWSIWNVGLNDPARFAAFWEDRIETAKTIVDQGRQGSAATSFETLLWESSYCFWLVSVGRGGEAQPVLNRNRDDWLRVFPESDPWHAQLGTLDACAVIAATLEKAGGAELSKADRARAEEAASLLRDADDVFSGAARGTGLHRLCLLTLHKMYSSEPFRDMKEFRALEPRFVNVGMKMPPDPAVLKAAEAKK